MKELKQRLKLIVLGIAMTGLIGPYLAVATVNAAAAPASSGQTNSVTDACAGLTQLDSTQACAPGSTSGESAIEKIIIVATNILSWVVGVVAVIAIIISGFRYVTSGGDSGKTSAAKTNLIYALVGLLIVALAQFLVNFVLFQGGSAIK
jgi:hypothetical protein